MRYYLGIDGGGTKTKFLLVDETGATRGEFVGATCHYLQCGLDGLTRILADGLTRCLQMAGIGADSLAHIYAACAGYGDVPGDTPRIHSAVTDALGDTALTLGNDSENAWAGALGGKPGINLVGGTGAIAYGRDESGASMRCGGWHHFLGSDEGSGYWIAQQLLHAFTRQSDGRSPKTALHGLVRQALSLESDYDIITVVVERWQMDRTKIAALSRLATQLAAQGEPFSLELFQRAAQEFADLAIAIRNGLRFTGPVLCSYTGGVFQSGPVLLDPLRQRLEQAQIRLQPPLLEPDGGAVILAMLGDGRPPDDAILQRLQVR